MGKVILAGKSKMFDPLNVRFFTRFFFKNKYIIQMLLTIICDYIC